MNIIPCVCHTNIDEYKKEIWPIQMCCRPIEGDNVWSQSGKILKIVRIAHMQRNDGSPLIVIELHK